MTSFKCSLWKIILCYISLRYLVVANPVPDIRKQDEFDRVINSNLQIEDYFSIDKSSLETFATIIDESTNTVYLKLNVTNIVWEDSYLAYLEEKAFSKYIDPLLFTFARPELSYLLLSLPFDSIPSSVKGLAFAVTNVNINIELLDPDNFFNLNDTMQLDLMYQLAETIVREAGDLNRGSPGEFALCLDHIEDRMGIYTSIRSAGAALLSNRYPLIQSIRDCRQYDVVSDSLPEGNYWVNDLNLILSVCITVFAPLAFLLFFPKNPPFQDKDGIMKMTPRTDLPIGFQYVTCYSYSEKKGLKIIRFIFGLLLLVSLSYLQPVIAYLTDSDDYTRRVLALERFDNTAHLVYFGTTLAYYTIFAIVSFMYLVQVVLPDKDGDCWETDTSRRYLTGMQLPRELWVPKVHQPFTKSALLNAQFRMTMVFDFRVWRFEYQRLLNWVTSEEHPNTSLPKLIFRIASFITLFIPYTITVLLRFILNSLPIFYIAKQTIWYTKKIPIGAMILILSAARIAPIVWYVINILQLTLTSLVTNQFIVLPALVITLGLASFVTSAINRYHKEYEVLTTDIFNEVACLQEWIQSTSSGEYDLPRPPVNTGSAPRPSVNTGRAPRPPMNTDSAPSTKSSNSISEDISNGIQYIKDTEHEELSIDVNLYTFIVNAMQNTQKRLTFTTLSLLVTASVGAITYQFLVYIDKIIPIGPAMFLISAILISLALPALYNLISIAPSYNSNNNGHRRQIRKLIIKYYRREAIVNSICRKTGLTTEQRDSYDIGESNGGFANNEIELTIQSD